MHPRRAGGPIKTMREYKKLISKHVVVCSLANCSGRSLGLDTRQLRPLAAGDFFLAGFAISPGLSRHCVLKKVNQQWPPRMHFIVTRCQMAKQNRPRHTYRVAPNGTGRQENHIIKHSASYHIDRAQRHSANVPGRNRRSICLLEHFKQTWQIVVIYISCVVQFCTTTVRSGRWPSYDRRRWIISLRIFPFPSLIMTVVG